MRELFRCGGYKMITGIPTLISTATPSNTDIVDITSGIDSTYNTYLFVFTDIYLHQDRDKLTFQTGASYNTATTTAPMSALNLESGGTGVLEYAGGIAFSNMTTMVELSRGQSNAADACIAGILYLYNPSSTSFLKQFAWNFSQNEGAAASSLQLIGSGSINSTSAITQVRFEAQANNMTGTIQMYGIT